MLTDRQIVEALVQFGLSRAEAQRELRGRDTAFRETVLRSKARRDRIATAALQGLLIHSAGLDGKPVDYAQGAVAHADALIAELDK